LFMKRKAKILLIDDDPHMIEITEARMKANGYRFVGALDGVEGINLIRKEKPDIILLDVTMPRIDGFSLCKIIKGDKNMSRIPVIFITAKELINDVEKGFEVGADDYAIKPVDWDRLMEKIERLLEE